MMLSVSDIKGLGSLPIAFRVKLESLVRCFSLGSNAKSDKRCLKLNSKSFNSKMGVHKWLKTNDVPLCEVKGRFEFRRADLPMPVQQSYLEHLADDAALDMGEHDDAAHEALFERPLKAQQRAQENAVKLMFIAKREGLGMAWSQIAQAGKKAFGSFPSRNTAKCWKQKTDGVAPANWAPALLPDWIGSENAHPVSPEAWDRLETIMLLSGKNGTGYPLKLACAQVAVEAEKRGWDWPIAPNPKLESPIPCYAAHSRDIGDD